jgi:hypothetical protein
MGNAASSSITFARSLFESPYMPSANEDPTYTHYTTTMLQSRAHRGTERPSSESFKTPESLKQDQLAHKCLYQIEQQRELTQDSFNYLLKLLKDDFSPKVRILSSSEVDAKAFAFPFSDFVTPLYHHRTECWSVICVSIQNQSNQNRGRPLVKVQYYDPDPQQGRHSEVREKIRSWAEQRHGKNVEFQYIHAVSLIMQTLPLGVNTA